MWFPALSNEGKGPRRHDALDGLDLAGHYLEIERVRDIRRVVGGFIVYTPGRDVH